MRTAVLDKSNDEERRSAPKKGRCFSWEEIKASFESSRANPIASISCSLPCVGGAIKQAKYQVEACEHFPISQKNFTGLGNAQRSTSNRVLGPGLLFTGRMENNAKCVGLGHSNLA